MMKCNCCGMPVLTNQYKLGESVVCQACYSHARYWEEDTVNLGQRDLQPICVAAAMAIGAVLVFIAARYF